MKNDALYWEKRFSTNWVSKGGSEQTEFFANFVIQNLPAWVIDFLKNKPHTFCDIGCALGEGTNLLKLEFNNLKCAGLDISKKAVEIA